MDHGRDTLTWFKESMNLNNAPSHSNFLKDLQAHFGYTQLSIQLQLRELKINGTIKQFCTTFSELFYQLQPLPKDDDLCWILEFVLKLPTRISKLINLSEQKSLKDVVATAQRLDSHDFPNLANNGYKQSEQRKKQTPRKTHLQLRFNNNRKPMMRYKCNLPGHIAHTKGRNCPLLRPGTAITKETNQPKKRT